MVKQHRYICNTVVIIATSMKRTDLLINRALLSVYKQADVNPLCIYIIDDNEDPEEYFKLKKRVKSFRKSFFSKEEPSVQQSTFHTVVMRNKRTRQHSGAGAWNTAAEHAFRHYTNGRKTYVAILDDDDEWTPNYLSSCLSKVDSIKESYVPAVICGLTRIEEQKQVLIQIKDKEVSVDSFLVGNPGWQGSNTFVEMKSFWEAGGFDESFTSTLDRDFAIRLIDISRFKKVQIQVLKENLVHHYAHENKRVTTDYKHKKRGLDRFYVKYLPRMSSEIRERSLARAHKLFGYTLIDSEAEENIPDHNAIELFFKDENSVPIIFGVVSSNSKNIKLQLESLDKQLQKQPQFRGKCTYLLLTNGSDEEAIIEIAKNFNSLRFKLELIKQADQKELLHEFPHYHLFKDESLDAKSIAYSRSLLHYCCWKEHQNKHKKNEIVVILDDDLLFQTIIETKNGYKIKTPCFLGKLSKLSRDVDADILISSYSGSPPLPFYSTLRTQLIDLYYLTTNVLNSERESSDLGMTFRCEKSRKEDYYYDLSSKSFSFLEFPQLDMINIKKEDDVSLVEGFIEKLVNESHATRLLSTSSVEWESTEVKESYLRGGIAIYLNLKLLIDIPNISPSSVTVKKTRYIRRSDFIASLVASEIFQKKIMNVSFPMIHDRNHHNKPCKLSVSKLSDDIIGLCFYRVLKEKLYQEEISDRKLNAIFDHEVRLVLGKLKTNNLRIISLIKQIAFNINAYRNSLNEPKDDSLFNPMLENLKHLENEYATRKFKEQLVIVKRELINFDCSLRVKELLLKYKSL